jgi:hypothetical protein
MEHEGSVRDVHDARRRAVTISAYPLAWAPGWKRTPPYERSRGKFGVRAQQFDAQTGRHYLGSLLDITIADGVDRVLLELQRLGVDGDANVIVSTNVPTRRDGLPKSGREPDDPGAAVYWTLDGERQCLCMDQYERLADNLAAVAATISAMRSIERHGGAQILKRAFQGFKALPETSGTTMGVEAARHTLFKFSRLGAIGNTSDVEAQKVYARHARHHTHPDRNGGSAGDFQLVQKAAETLSTHFGTKL